MLLSLLVFLLAAKLWYELPLDSLLWLEIVELQSEFAIKLLLLLLIQLVLIVQIYYFIIITIIIELIHSKTILENTAEIEPQPVALDTKNLSQYSSRSK